MTRLPLAKALIVAALGVAASPGGIARELPDPEVNTVPDRHRRADYRPDQVIVKFKTTSRANVRRAATGRVTADGSTALASILKNYGVAEASELMPLTGASVARRHARAYNGRTVADRDMSRLWNLTFSPSQQCNVQALVDELSALPEVEYAEPNYIVYSTATAADFMAEPMYGQQWGLPAVGLDKLWQAPLVAGRRPVIAILDTGVDITHPDLKDNIWTNTTELDGAEGHDDDANGLPDDIHGWDFVNASGRMRDNNGHGTHCAGIAAACGSNGLGITGANPDALIMPVTVMQNDGTGDVATIIKGIDYAAANGADVISMSFGGYYDSHAEEEALGKAYQKAVLVAAAGNDGKCIYPEHFGAPMFPAAYSFVLGVQASGQDGERALFSNGDCDGPVTSTFAKLYNYELTAPGTPILSTFPGGQYRQLSGTSMACPLVAGAISRLITARDIGSKERLFGDLINTARGGVVDFAAAYGLTDADRRPTLKLVTWRIDDEKMGDGDGRPDAGETIRIYPTFRNDWGMARNITYSIALAETEDPEIVEFIDGQTVNALSDLSDYATAEAETPVLVKISPDCVDGRRICFVVRAECDGITAPLEQEIVLSAENGVELGGVIARDMTLTPDKNYIVVSPLGIAAGATLTIEPGTTLKFRDGTGLSIADGGMLIAKGTPEKRIVFTSANLVNSAIISSEFYFSEKNSQTEYCEFSNMKRTGNNLISNSWLNNSLLRDLEMNSAGNVMNKCQLINSKNYAYGEKYCYTNVVNTRFGSSYPQLPASYNSNWFNNSAFGRASMSAFAYSSVPALIPNNGNYLGSAKRSIVERNVIDINDLDGGFGQFDYDNITERPNAEAHGIVWKVVVNGYDAQDEYDLLPPLGVGRHKFEVWFNRPMNKAKAPMVAMGVRDPYTQTPIAEDGAWNEAGDCYTAYLTITGRDSYDGVNTVYVNDAEDTEYFPIPVENVRYRVNVQSAGSMSTGFAAEPGLGKVTLTWENPGENVDDLLGYNLYRYTVNDLNEATEPRRINETLLDREEFTDYDVTPGTTYCYYYKVMTTALTENSPSKTVSTTPLTSVKGDANGSMAVDIADVVTEVAYMLAQNPRPFIFEAADVNADTEINILDVVGTLNIIMQPAAAGVMTEGSARCWIDGEGVLFVDTDVALAGLQFRLEGIEDVDAADAVALLPALDGMEVARGTVDGAMMVMAYSMTGRTVAPGTHALLKIAGQGARVGSVALSDKLGHNVEVEVTGGNADAITVIAPPVSRGPWPNPFITSVTIPYVMPLEIGAHTVELLITDLAGRVVGRLRAEGVERGEHALVWTPQVQPGIYIATLSIDGREAGVNYRLIRK